MNWLQKLLFKAATSRAVRFAPNWMRYAFLPVGWARLIEGYTKNSAVAACVTTLAFSFSEPPLLAGYDDESGRFLPDYGNEIMTLIRQPNPDMGEVELMQFAATYASIGGNCYFWKQRANNGRVIAIWPFSDAQISPVPGQSTADGFVKEYELDPGDGQKVTLPKNDVIQWKWMPDPSQPWRGIGAIEFAIREVDRDAEATSYIYSLLKNNAVPPVVVTMAEGDDFDENKADRMRAQWRSKLGGDNAGNVAFIEYGMKAEKMGFNLQELAAEALNAVPEARIAAAFRVPPVVAGLSVGLKRSDYGDQAARRSFTELTLTALWRSLASELYNGLKDDFGVKPNFNLRFDLRQVRALLEEETKIWERVTLAFDRGVITRRMAKEMLGLLPETGDDVYKVSLATEFVPAGRGAVERSSSPEKQEQPPSATPRSPKFDEHEFRGRDRGMKASAVNQVLLRIRNEAAKRMTAAVDVYFADLGNRVVERLQGMKAGGSGVEVKADLPNADDLLTGEDRKRLEKLVKRFYVDIVKVSWETWNTALGIEKAFDLNDPAVTRILKEAGMHIREIEDAVLKNLRDALQYGSENGWGIDELVRGNEQQPGLRELLTDKDYARLVARAELGNAQNGAAVERYREAGVTKVEILDGGAEDSAPACELANGQIWTLELFEANRLQHPNCSRCPAPYFGDEEAESVWPYPFGERG